MNLIRDDPSFRSGLIEIPELGVSVDLPENSYYKQEVWSDVNDGIEAICSKYGAIPLERNPTLYGHSGVLTLRNSFLGEILFTEIGYYQLILSDLDPLNHLTNVGHENGHFLFNLGRQDLIWDQLGMKSLGYDTEDFATLCQYFALHRGNYNITNIFPGAEDNPNPQQNRVRLELIKMLGLK